MIAYPFPCKGVVLYIWGFIYGSAVRGGRWNVNSCWRLFPQELNLAPASAALLNVLGEDPQLMTHPGE